MSAHDGPGDEPVYVDDRRKDENLLQNEQSMDETAGAAETIGPRNGSASKAFQFLGYRQTEGADPAEAERCLDLVYDRIIQAALRARARKTSDAGQGSHLCAGSDEAAKLPVSHKGEVGWSDSKEP